MMKSKRLDELEMFELMQAAYPEKFRDDTDETWEAVQRFVEEIADPDALSDLLGRVVMLTMPMRSGLTGRLSHCLGAMTIENGQAQMIAAVLRDVQENKE